MKIGVIMYQTSLSKGQELVAQGMTRTFRNLGFEAYLITGPYHDGKRVVSADAIDRSTGGYVVDDKDHRIPMLRVGGYVSGWPPRRIMFRNFVDTLRNIINDLDLDVLVTHSTLWNGPEDTAKFVLWTKTMRELGLHQGKIAYCHMPHYQPPHPVGYHVAERSFRMAWNRLVFPQVFRVADLILVTTPIEKEYMIRMGAKEEQCHLFPGGLDEELFAGYEDISSALFRTKLGISENKKIISFLGTIEERKNPLAVARIARRLRDMRDVHFVIAGRVSDQGEQVRNEVRDLANLSCVGEISNEEKVQLIKGSYLNILMSRMEALGMTQIEFMYGGIPIITSAVGGQKWLIRNGVEGIHVNGPEDVEGAAVAIRKLVENVDLRNEMSQKARGRSEEFKLEKLTKGFHAMLQTILENSTCPER
jgi:glycosyltransferase involved in cell wall biosynthesis